MLSRDRSARSGGTNQPSPTIAWLVSGSRRADVHNVDAIRADGVGEVKLA